MSDKMLMETNKKGKSYRVATDRTGSIQIETGNRRNKGICVWVKGDFSSIKDEFLGYAQIVAKTRPRARGMESDNKNHVSDASFGF